MNRLKISFIVASIIILVIGLIFTLSFNNKFPSDAALTCFIACKVIVSLLFIGGVCFALMSNAKTGSSATIVGLGILLQFEPLLVRFLLKSNINYNVAISWSIILISIALYVVIPFGLSFQDKLMVKSDEASAANEIKVMPEKRFANDDKE